MISIILDIPFLGEVESNITVFCASCVVVNIEISDFKFGVHLGLLSLSLINVGPSIQRLDSKLIVRRLFQASEDQLNLNQ